MHRVAADTGLASRTGLSLERIIDGYPSGDISRNGLVLVLEPDVWLVLADGVIICRHEVGRMISKLKNPDTIEAKVLGQQGVAEVSDNVNHQLCRRDDTVSEFT